MQPQHFASLTDALYKLEDDGHGGVTMIARPHMDAAVKRELRRMEFKDAATAPQNNLRIANPAFLPGAHDNAARRAPRNGVADEGATGTQGTQGSPAGGAPRRAERPPTPASLKSGQFTVDQPEKPGTSQQYKYPSIDQEEDPEDNTGLGQVIASLEDPGPGMTYKLQRQDDGSIAIVVCEDDGEDMNMSDTTYRHSLGDAANVQWNRRLNGINRRRWSRTRDWAASQPTTLFRHKALAPGERLELQADAQGGYSLILFSPIDDQVYGNTSPPGASGGRQSANPGTPYGAATWSASAGSRPGEHDIHELDRSISTGDRRLSEPQMLRSMNEAARQFWAR